MCLGIIFDNMGLPHTWNKITGHGKQWQLKNIDATSHYSNRKM